MVTGSSAIPAHSRRGWRKRCIAVPSPASATNIGPSSTVVKRVSAAHPTATANSTQSRQRPVRAKIQNAYSALVNASPVATSRVASPACASASHENA